MRKMIKKLISFVIILAFAFVPSLTSAQSLDLENNSGLTKVNTEQLTYEGESFELVTWEDENGEEIFTIATEVKNKEGVAEYVNQLIANEEEDSTSVNENTSVHEKADNSVQGVEFPWDRSLSNTDTLGKFDWKPTGVNEQATLTPITSDSIYINAANFNAYYSGAGNADKMVVYYEYAFSGYSLYISHAPSLVLSGNTVSWKSEAVTGTWFINTKSHWAESTSRLPTMTGVTLSGGADIYKGGNIYRPYNKAKKVTFPAPNA